MVTRVGHTRLTPKIFTTSVLPPNVVIQASLVEDHLLRSVSMPDKYFAVQRSKNMVWSYVMSTFVLIGSVSGSVLKRASKRVIYIMFSLVFSTTWLYDQPFSGIQQFYVSSDSNGGRIQGPRATNSYS